MPAYTSLIEQFYESLSSKLSSRCSAINVNMNVTFLDAEAFVADDNMVTVSSNDGNKKVKSIYTLFELHPRSI
jgi:hypothetical protein